MPATIRQRLSSISQIARILAARRKAANMSQQELAKKLGINQSALSQIERGSITLSVQRLLEIANALDLDLIVQTRPRSSKTDW